MDKKTPKTPSFTRGCTFLQNKSTSTVVENGDSFYCLNQSVPRPIVPRPRTPYPHSTPGRSNAGPSQAGPSHAGPSNAGPSNPPALPARRPSTLWGKTFLAPDDDSSSDHSSTIRQKTPVRSRYGYLQGFPFPDPPLPEQDDDTPAVSPSQYASKTAPGPSRLREQVVLSPPVAGEGEASSGSDISELSLGPPVVEGGARKRLGSLSLQERVEESHVVVEEEVRQKTPSPPGGQKKASPRGEPPPVQPFDNAALTDGEGAEGGEYLTGVKLGCLIVALMASLFMVSLDRTIISTATPYITQEFKSTPDIGWYGATYLLTACAFQPVFGRVFWLFSVKTAFLMAMFVFLLGSLLCGIAHSSMALIMGRAVAGLGSAGVLSGSFVIVAKAVPLRLRPVFMAVVGIMFGVGVGLGPILGGVFTDMVTWRWCFFINLPIGGAIMIAMGVFFKPWQNNHADRTIEARLRDLDLVGNVLLLGGFIMLLLALQRTAVGVPWRSQEIIGLMTGSGVVGVLFVGWECWKGDDALLPPRIMGKRTVAASCGLGFLTYGAIINLTYFLPIWFQVIHGDSAIMSGVHMLPYYGVNAAFSVLGGFVVSVTGYATPPAIIGSALGTVGLGLLTLLNVETTTAQWVGFQLLTSAGFGLSIQQCFTAVQTVLGEDDIAIGTTAVIASQSLGGAVFLTVGNSVFQSLLRQSSASEGDRLPGVKLKMMIDLKRIIGAGASAQMRDELAVYNGALRMVFMVGVPLGALAALVSCFIEIKSVRPVPRGDGEWEGAEAWWRSLRRSNS